ncbi:MAG: hypothetical protein IPL78_33205 [Chloroflexi bacterium]|nr:hypothetical protein [Chloroflexota bacterium]
MRDKLLVSEWLYGVLLYLYPKRFRAVYGQQMRLTFRDACWDAYRRGGAGGLLVLWLSTLLDLFKSVLEERARQGEITMSKARLITLAGPLTIVVGALWVVSSIGDFAFQIGLFSNEGFLGFVFIPFFLSIVPMLFALIGTRLRFHQSAGVLGRLGLALSVAGCVGVIVAVLATTLLSRPWVNYAAVGCVLSIRIGYILFGVDALRYRLLPRGNLLPLLVGLTVVLSLPLYWFGVPAFLPTPWATPFLHFALTGAGWVLLGVAMMDQRREPQPTAVI